MSSSSAVSFQGLITGVQTDALISAILAEEGTSVAAMQARKDFNTQKQTALTSMRTSLNALVTSLASFQDKLNSRTVTSTDANNTNVTATATGGTSGSYDLTVTTVATKGRISSTQVNGTANLVVADPSAAIYSADASFAVRGTDGVVKTFQLANNSLNGLRDAINASGAGVTASVINTGSGDKPYQLVVTAKDTGTGTTGGVVSLATIAGTALDSSLGITSGTLGLDTDGVTQTLTGGLTSDASGASAKDAKFTLNGIELTRKSNVISDAADGITFTLKQGGQTGTTTLTVAQDKASATTGIQDVITKYNTLVTGYKTASTSTKNSDGSINKAALSGDATTRAMMAQIKNTLVGASGGLPSTSAYQNLSSLGITTLADGTLSLNSYKFQTAITNNPTAAQKLFTFTGDSTNGVVTFKAAGSATATGTVGFKITSDGNGGLTGTLSRAGYADITAPVTNGILNGTGDLQGLTLAVTGAGSGTLTLSRGAGQATSDLLSSYTLSGSGTLATALKNIDTQNTSLSNQISQGQARLARRKVVLTQKYSDMEVKVAQMRAAAGQLSSTG